MEKNLIECPIDNKNIMEDPFEDDVFRDFYDANNHLKDGIRHLIGFVQVRDEKRPSCINAECYVDVSWNYGSNSVTIKVLGANTCVETFNESRDMVFAHYKKIFSSWMRDCDGLVVRFGSENDSLYVHFYWRVE